MKRVLVCEDEEAIREFVVINLTRAGYDVVDVDCGEAALRVFDQENGNFDIVVLDIMMPGIDGITVLKKLREKTKIVGIIMLSAKAQEMDKVNALMNLADDYITKPFAPSELTARVDVLYNRVRMNSMKEDGIKQLESGPFVIDLSAYTVTKNGVPIALTDTEYKILCYFLRNKNTALDRASILSNAWTDTYFGDNKIVDVNIRRLRMKIEDDPSDPQYITTIWGYGYKWEEKADTPHTGGHR